MYRCLSLIAFLLCAICAPSLQARPNIVFILVDDMGFGDLGCYGQKTLKTPNIDRLAQEGLRFDQHYAGSTVCAPSRCVLLTGLHSGHARIRGNNSVLLKPEDITMAEVLRDAGYRTGCVGKWGVGHPPPDDDPNQNGFDYFYGYVNMWHAHNFFPEWIVRNGERLPLRNVPMEKWKGSALGNGVAETKVDYVPALAHQEALNFIDGEKDHPFFLYYALNIPHANNEGGRVGRGMEVPDYGAFAEKDWPEPEKGFAQMMYYIDTWVGEVLAKLQEHNLDENTMVVFASDNGPHQEGGHKMDFFDSNGAFSGMKRDFFDGGIRVPALVRWPKKVPADRVSDHISSFQDWMPTLCELAGVKSPPTDGLSLVPTLMGKKGQHVHPHLYWEFHERGGKTAVLKGKWKGIRLNTKKMPDGPIQLYDRSTDVAEQKDVAGQYPEIVSEIEAIMRKEHVPMDSK